MFEHLGQIDTETGEGLAGLVDESEVRQVIEQGSSHEEFSGEVVLLALGFVRSVGVLPVICDTAHDTGR